MSNYNIIRAWKEEDYFESLSSEERSQLPENPAGMTELSDADMEILAGGGDFSVVVGGCVFNNLSCCFDPEVSEDGEVIKIEC